MPYMPDRRSFLIAGGLTALASTRVFGANERLRIGVIGAGGRMRGLLGSAEATRIPLNYSATRIIQDFVDNFLPLLVNRCGISFGRGKRTTVSPTVFLQCSASAS